jgi:hypothetical protein
VSDQLKAGEISLIETTPEKVKAAKVRLDILRKKAPGPLCQKGPVT